MRGQWIPGQVLKAEAQQELGSHVAGGTGSPAPQKFGRLRGGGTVN